MSPYRARLYFGLFLRLGGVPLALAWAVWLAGAALTVCALARSPAGIAIATGVLFALFCPLTVCLGRALPRLTAAAGWPDR